ncbi:MAG: NAD(P)/FAD-dependent oxidoreductase, partial [Candidatus Eremiobacteraeota bacterium]|nr:NAD(P)/FAD-dependent oxidoreductase [Candidatus Eremiobacteraeota bacterium]
APAVYALLPVVEMVGGIWYAAGGTAAIVDALVASCIAAGVRMHFSSRIERVVVFDRRARGIVVRGKTKPTDGVIIASDREPALTSLLHERPKKSRLRYGHSALVTYLGIEGAVDLPHHTVMLPNDPWRSYAELERGIVPESPAFYVCNPVVTDAGCAPRGFSSISMLVPVPNRAAAEHLDERAVFGRALTVLEGHVGKISDRIAYSRTIGPAAFENDFGLARGAAFGPDHALSQMGPLRPSIAYRGARNVAFAGSGTRPGSGVPLVLISGRLAAQHIVKSFS